MEKHFAAGLFPLKNLYNDDVSLNYADIRHYAQSQAQSSNYICPKSMLPATATFMFVIKEKIKINKIFFCFMTFARL